MLYYRQFQTARKSPPDHAAQRVLRRPRTDGDSGDQGLYKERTDKVKALKTGVLAAALAAMAAGCATENYSSPRSLDGISVKGIEGRQAEQMVVISTTGYYVLWTIPLFSGDLEWNPEKRAINGGTTFFSDMVGVSELQEALLKIAETRNCDLADVHYTDSDSSYAGASESGIIGMLFGSSQMSVSALLVPRNQAK